MRGLLIVGCIALGIVLVAAAHQDQAASEIEAKNESAQGDFVNDRAIRSTDGNKKKKPKPPKKTPGGFTSLARPDNTRVIRALEESGPQQGKRKKCPGCYTPLISSTAMKSALTPEIRQQRDTEEHDKLRKKHKHLKEKSKGRRRNKHKERHAHFQSEDPEIGDNNNKRRKHHRGKKNQRRPGMHTFLAEPKPRRNNMDIDNRDTQDMTE